MRNEPENRVEDTRVTDAYRAVANECAPDHLNRKILTMAARAATPYARARAWMRPAAWAATIALSFAFVLELTQLPSTDLSAPGISPAADSDAFERRNLPDEDIATKARTFAPESLSPLPLDEAESVLEMERKRAATPPARRDGDVRSKEAFMPRDITVMQNAEDLARAQAGSDQGVAAATAQASSVSGERPSAKAMSAELAAARRQEADRLAADRISAEAQSAAASLVAASDPAGNERACPTAAREAPETWLACIRELRENGQDDKADDEYEAFRRLFPEFDDSDTYK